MSEKIYAHRIITYKVQEREGNAEALKTANLPAIIEVYNNSELDVPISIQLQGLKFNFVESRDGANYKPKEGDFVFYPLTKVEKETISEARLGRIKKTQNVSRSAGRAYRRKIEKELRSHLIIHRIQAK